MNNRRELNHWIETGNDIWFKAGISSPCWILADVPNFANKDFIYAINDKYAEFRKLEKEGIEIQIMNRNGVWIDKPIGSNFNKPVYCYREKQSWKWQDELKNRDYIVCKVWDIDPSVYCYREVICHNESAFFKYRDVNSTLWQNAEPVEKIYEQDKNNVTK